MPPRLPKRLRRVTVAVDLSIPGLALNRSLLSASSDVVSVKNSLVKVSVACQPTWRFSDLLHHIQRLPCLQRLFSSSPRDTNVSALCSVFVGGRKCDLCSPVPLLATTGATVLVVGGDHTVASAAVAEVGGGDGTEVGGGDDTEVGARGDDTEVGARDDTKTGEVTAEPEPVHAQIGSHGEAHRFAELRARAALESFYEALPPPTHDPFLARLMGDETVELSQPIDLNQLEPVDPSNPGLCDPSWFGHG